MAYNPVNPNGQATSANSAPVVIASDQSTVNVADSTVATNTGTIATNTTNLTPAQGSTTSGQVGPLIQTATTTSAPSYTTAKTNPLSTDTAGNLRVNVVTGGASSTQYTELATTSSATGTLSLGRYSSSLPTLTNGQMNEPMLDSSSRILTNVTTSALPTGAATSANQTNGSQETQIVGNSNIAYVDGSNNLQVNVNAGNVAKETSGNLATTATNTTGLNNTVGTAGSAIPSKGQIVQGSDGTNARAIKTDTAGNVSVVGTGTLAVQDSTTETNTGTIATNTTNLTPAQGSTTSGQVGPLIQTATTTSAPSYTTAKTNPLSTDTAGNLRVNVVTGGASSTQYTELATTSSATGTLSLGRYSSSLPTLTNGQMNEPMLDSSSRLFVNISNASLPVTQSSAASLNATVVGTGTFAVQNTNQTSATGGATAYSYISTASTNGNYIKSSAGTLYSCVCMNTSTSARYVRLFNLASAPTVGTSTPYKRFLVPAGGGFTYPIPPQGIAFGTGIAFDITAGAADSDTTATAANDVFLNIDYS